MSSTRTSLTGNPLAVFTDERGLTDKEMQLWREMNLSSLTVEPGIKDQIIGSSFWREAKSPSRTGIARASGSVEPTARREARALPSRIRKCRRLPFLRIGPDGEVVDQRDGSAKAAFCSATRMNRQSARPSRQRPFDRPALDKRADPADYRNDDGDSSAPVLCRRRRRSASTSRDLLSANKIRLSASQRDGFSYGPELG